MMQDIVELLRGATGAHFAQLVLASDLSVAVRAGEPTNWLETGATASVFPEAHLKNDVAPNSTTAPWVQSYATMPVTGTSAEPGYLVLASRDANGASVDWFRPLASAAALIEDRLDRLAEHRRIDQMAQLLRSNQERLHATEAQLRVANGELEQFAYIAAHELVAPLRAVAVYAEVLEELTKSANDDIAETSKACAREIRDGVALMNQQVKYLLELSQGASDATDIEPIDLTDVVQRTVDTLAPALEEAAAVVNIGELAVVHGRQIPLQSVFANLLSNAVRYRHPHRPLVLDIRSEAVDDHVIVTVSDSGVGVAESDRQRIFQLFERASTDPAGSGIGLALSRRIIESFGGEIGVHPASDAGASFWIRLPRLSR